MGGDLCITSVSVWESLRIHILSFLIGVWVVLKRFAKWAWNPKAFFTLQIRDNPPACLVDSTFGHHSYVKLKGVKFHYVESGRQHKQLLLLLHGFPDCWLTWRYQMKILSQHFHVIALDLKGFGDSDKPLSRKCYRIDTLLIELKQFIFAVSSSRCTLIGHNLGALLGWYFVHRYPDMIDKFITVSCPHPNLYWDNLSNKSIFNSVWMNFIQLPYLPEIDVLKEDLRVIDDYFKHLHQKDPNSSASMKALKYSFSRKEDWTGPINYFRNLPFSRVRMNSRIAVPVLFITGNKDDSVKLEGIIKSTEYCDKFTMKIIENSGHFPHQEKSDVFNKVVLDYLQILESVPKSPERTFSKGLMDKMFGAVSTTVKYGNSVFDSVQKRTTDVISIPSRALHFHNSS